MGNSQVQMGLGKPGPYPAGLTQQVAVEMSCLLGSTVGPLMETGHGKGR